MQRIQRRFGRRRNERDEALLFLGGLGAGGALMYLFDPDRGARRRGLLRDKMVGLMHESEDAFQKTSEDLKNRTRGMVAEMQSRLTGKEIPDRVLVARVRSAMGRVVSHPGAIEVSAENGRVTLRGHILSDEVDQLLSTVQRIGGVVSVDNQLQAHKQAGDIPDLQGGRPRPGRRPDVLQKNWAPATRFVASIVGGGLAFAGLRRGDPLGAALGAAGVGLFARGLTNKELKRLLGLGGGRRAVDIQKTITVNAPPEEVFAFWSNFENFPRFMSHLREVHDLGNGRSRWRVEGPAGMSVEWDAIITKMEPNRILAWKSVPGSIIKNAGIIHFDRTTDGGTRIDIKLSYNPPAGAIGHAFASLFGADPKTAMDDDLLRFKSLIEAGKTTAHDRKVTREEIEREIRERGGQPGGAEM
ncbi:MAG: hypothetical protein KatS3mg057_2721 [Herpetosiphonaceae bacterium]|nr:MAG: hypothetical protein KatS3mg057_2721 [Herpetosiphonaceae bacterium]